MRSIIPIILLSISISSCAVFKPGSGDRKYRSIQKEVERSTVFAKSFSGMLVMDPESGKTLVNYNGDKLFIPASNTKILTLATCLSVLQDSVPGIKIASRIEQGDTTGYYAPTGDPTFLHPLFKAWQPVQKHLKSLEGWNYILLNTLQEDRFGPGWAWDDYAEPYSVGRSSMPIFGNKVRLKKSGNGWALEPDILDDVISGIREGFDNAKTGLSPQRDESDNVYYIPYPDTISNGYSHDFPIHRPENLIPSLRDTLGDKFFPFVSWTEEEKQQENDLLNSLNWQTINSCPLDTVLRLMMYQSDNFVAEQLLLLCGGVKFDILGQDSIIHWVSDSLLTEFPQKPRWVDGSGLSRYNLLSPQDLAYVLQYLWKSQTKERLFDVFPAGGQDGTIQDWYKGANGQPYVYAKSGSMSGVQNLSGYLVCKSGKVLIFSFMHNNFTGSGKAWKLEMQQILEKLAQLE